MITASKKKNMPFGCYSLDDGVHKQGYIIIFIEQEGVWMIKNKLIWEIIEVTVLAGCHIGKSVNDEWVCDEGGAYTCWTRNWGKRLCLLQNHTYLSVIQFNLL